MIPVVVLGLDYTSSPVEGTGLMRRETVPVVDDDDNAVMTLNDHPVIVMDETGEIVYGFECWWIELAEFVTANQMVLPAFGRVL